MKPIELEYFSIDDNFKWRSAFTVKNYSTDFEIDVKRLETVDVGRTDYYAAKTFSREFSFQSQDAATFDDSSSIFEANEVMVISRNEEVDIKLSDDCDVRASRRASFEPESAVQNDAKTSEVTTPNGDDEKRPPESFEPELDRRGSEVEPQNLGRQQSVGDNPVPANVKSFEEKVFQKKFSRELEEENVRGISLQTSHHGLEEDLQSCRDVQGQDGSDSDTELEPSELQGPILQTFSR